MQASSSKKISYRRDIDGLRAIAVLSVFAYHLSPERIKGGFVGVDIFFVISGFLISSIIYNELESSVFSIIDFYVRRVRRIYPALFIVLVAVCVAGWFILLPTHFVSLGKQIIGGSTFSANFILWLKSGYFLPEAEKIPLLHLWTLGVEEQFYLIFPWICVAFYRTKSRWTLPLAFLVIAMVSMAINVTFVVSHRDATFFLPFSRLWELFVGAGLSLSLHRNLQAPWESHILANWRTGIGFLGLALLVVSMFGIDQSDSFPGWWALLPTIGAALVIAAGEAAWSNRYILSCKPAVFVGLISYPLYLWHWPILSFLKIASVPWGFKISPLLKGAVIVLSFVLAYLTYCFIELPIRHVKQRSQRRKGGAVAARLCFFDGRIRRSCFIDGRISVQTAECNRCVRSRLRGRRRAGLAVWYLLPSPRSVCGFVQRELCRCPGRKCCATSSAGLGRFPRGRPFAGISLVAAPVGRAAGPIHREFVRSTGRDANSRTTSLPFGQRRSDRLYQGSKTGDCRSFRVLGPFSCRSRPRSARRKTSANYRISEGCRRSEGSCHRLGAYLDRRGAGDLDRWTSTQSQQPRA
jgi:peptidoglycan/LPS O-acetylase OafA/YrhL